MSVLTDQTDRLEDRWRTMFDLQNGHTLNGGHANLSEIRKRAMADFEAIGLPNRKTEAWKYTPIEKALPKDARIAREDNVSPGKARVAAHMIPGLDACVIVLFNGCLQPALSNLESLPAGVQATGLRAAASDYPERVNRHLARYAESASDPFVALNTAFLKEGFFFYVPERTVVEKPVHVIHLFDAENDEIVQPRSLFIVEAGSQLDVIESFASMSAAGTFINSVSEWVIAENAVVHHYQVQDFNVESTAVVSIHAHQAGRSNFSTLTTSLSGKMIRNNLTIVPDAEECESHLIGLVLGKGDMHIDNHTLVDHKKPNCFSNELYKNILDDASTAVFNGKVFVRPDAQKINAYQSNKSVTLTRRARMYSKPELEIYADDVKCSHGATTGQLDKDALFYLRTRGISEEKARSLLLMAFARDVIDKIKIEPLKAFIDEKIEHRL